ncbi:MAG: UDP-N-acetylglucosamine 2-epimerase (non-hydrolyzing) [Dinghuibacter sp.]|nr:UDP-N-acetylglucosamine 2-epimerase (non-hydrolyzing) [Dinghuibacter sp.]
MDSVNPNEILFVIGTRPELIKVAPVVMELKRQGKTNYKIVNTGQHKELLHPYWKVFGIQPDYDLDVIVPNQHLSQLTARALMQLQQLLESLAQPPRIILAQGDTTTVMAASMVAFYNKIGFAHLEAGLRSFDLYQPFPEEFNRKVASVTTAIHLAPTETAKQNLLNENVPEKDIHVIGNTVVDALEWIRRSPGFATDGFGIAELNEVCGKETVLITCHRRENHGEHLQVILGAVETLVEQHPELNFVWLLHPNPNVKEKVLAAGINRHANFFCFDPLDYWDLLKLLSRSKLAITDSGGIQEEAPSFGKPLIVLREVTERPEAVVAGMAKLAGPNHNNIINAFEWALQYRPADLNNPYGDGRSAERAARLLLGEQ